MVKIELVVFDHDGKMVDRQRYYDITKAVHDADQTNANGEYSAEVLINGKILSDVEQTRKEQLANAKLPYVHEDEDNSIGAVIHQGKTIAEWEKLFKKDFGFTQAQLLKLARNGYDLGRMLNNLDEGESIDDKALFKNEQFFFEKKDDGTVVDESIETPENVVTVGDFIQLLRKKAELDDKLVFRVDNKEMILFNVDSKGGIAIVDTTSKQIDESTEIINAEKWQEAADWFNKNGYPIEDDEQRLEQFAPQMDQFLFKAGCSPTGKDEVVDGSTAWELYQNMKAQTKLEEDIELDADGLIEDFMTVADLQKLGQSSYKNNSDAWLLDNIAGIVNGKVVDFNKIKYVRSEGYPTNGTFFLMDGTDASLKAYEKEKAIMLSEKEKQDVNEGRGWYGGGYGGTGRSYSKLGGKAPRGESIGWYSVEQLDPKAKGKMPGWRCGPSNFPFKDLFFPNRKYKVGTMVMRNKYVNAGPFSGEIQIAIPSYFEIINTGNAEGIDVLNKLRIPLDLTFGMDPKDDYTMTYTV